MHKVTTKKGELVYMDERLVPPTKAKKKLLLKLHESHSHETKAIWIWLGLHKEIQQSNRSCGKCIEFSRATFQQHPVLPIELCEYSPGEYMNMDLFKISKKDYLTITDKLSDLILGEKLKNKNAKETCRVVEALFLKVGPPSKLITDNGCNFTGNKLRILMKKY